MNRILCEIEISEKIKEILKCGLGQIKGRMNASFQMRR